MSSDYDYPEMSQLALERTISDGNISRSRLEGKLDAHGKLKDSLSGRLNGNFPSDVRYALDSFEYLTSIDLLESNLQSRRRIRNTNPDPQDDEPYMLKQQELDRITTRLDQEWSKYRPKLLELLETDQTYPHGRTLATLIATSLRRVVKGHRDFEERMPSLVQGTYADGV